MLKFVSVFFFDSQKSRFNRNVNPNLQPVNFLSTLHLLPIDGLTVRSSMCNSGSGNTILITCDQQGQDF